MRGYAFCAVLMLVLSAVPAMAYEDDADCDSDRRYTTTVTSDGTVYTTNDMGNLQVTAGSDGSTWTSWDTGRYVITNGPDGQQAVTFK